MARLKGTCHIQTGVAGKMDHMGELPSVYHGNQRPVKEVGVVVVGGGGGESSHHCTSSQAVNADTLRPFVFALGQTCFPTVPLLLSLLLL